MTKGENGEEGGAVRIGCPEKRERREGGVAGRDRASDRRGRGKEKPRPSQAETGAAFVFDCFYSARRKKSGSKFCHSGNKRMFTFSDGMFHYTTSKKQYSLQILKRRTLYPS